ncbi:MAG: cytidylate kinase-like family protein [Prevotella sp.]|nr:cytidylate kinase-like family protein [Prevotella sp.]
MRIITINREFGSGGREFGKRLADSLGFAYFDRQILTELSQKLALDQSYLERTLDTNWTHNYSLSFGKTLTTKTLATQNSRILAEQHKLVKQLAAQGDCVIVGSNADLVLDTLRPLRIFVYADMASKVARCRQRQTETENYSDREWEQKIRAIDKGRAATHDMVTSVYPWGDKRGYDFCVNTSGTVIKNMIPAMKQFVTTWFKEQTNQEHYYGN